ncbi:hypothetical protein POM88_052974 [Heracleum sosnowskyi]|uniref:FAR1 domain-containing protein n=1 Tax=Heracleum sosnowskyi TaxID=360622 RepID=A0AAD8GR71_9APIA|nr:hypothetical protein POM88_052974 [Heracleum sosnowskyi]
MDSCSVNGSLASNNVNDDASCELRVDDEIEDWVPDSPIKPYVGQIFTNIDAAFSYYSKHSSFCGFQVRRSTQRSRNGVVVSKYLCSKAGSREISSSSREDDASESSRISDKNVEPVKRRRTVSGNLIGSLNSLRFLDLSNIGFTRVIPHELGNLSDIHG